MDKCISPGSDSPDSLFFLPLFVFQLLIVKIVFCTKVAFSLNMIFEIYVGGSFILRGCLELYFLRRRLGRDCSRRRCYWSCWGAWPFLDFLEFVARDGRWRGCGGLGEVVRHGRRQSEGVLNWGVVGAFSLGF